jgi:hypothetical protein
LWETHLNSEQSFSNVTVEAMNFAGGMQSLFALSELLHQIFPGSSTEE